MTDQAAIPGGFPDRHIGITQADAGRMLAALGLASLDDLIDEAVPAAIRDDKPLALDDAMSEPHTLAHLRRLADRNRVLEALLNFQTVVCDLTGLEIANASMLDEATAAAEAMTLCRRSSRHTGGVFFVDAECHPQTIGVLATRAEPLGIDVVVGDPHLT